eukprot:1976841-Pleurochrysis_carterae.AAC.1
MSIPLRDLCQLMTIVQLDISRLTQHHKVQDLTFELFFPSVLVECNNSCYVCHSDACLPELDESERICCKRKVISVRRMYVWKYAQRFARALYCTFQYVRASA